MQSLPVRLRTWRAIYNVSQARAAQLADVSLKTWQRWELGIAKPAPLNRADLRHTLAGPPPGWAGAVARLRR